MAKYEVLETSFINNAIVEPGAIVEFDGEPGPNLKPVKGKKGSAAADAADTGDAGNTDSPQA